MKPSPFDDILNSSQAPDAESGGGIVLSNIPDRGGKLSQNKPSPTSSSTRPGPFDDILQSGATASNEPVGSGRIVDPSREEKMARFAQVLEDSEPSAILAREWPKASDNLHGLSPEVGTDAPKSAQAGASRVTGSPSKGAADTGGGAKQVGSGPYVGAGTKQDVSGNTSTEGIPALTSAPAPIVAKTDPRKPDFEVPDIAARSMEYLRSGKMVVDRGKLGHLLLSGQGDPELLKGRIKDLESTVPDWQKQEHGFWETAYGGALQQLPIWGSVGLKMGQGALEGAIAGSAASLLSGGSTAAPMALGGAKVGATYRGLEEMYKIEAGNAYLEYTKNGIREDIAGFAARGYGIVASGVELLQLASLATGSLGFMNALNEAKKVGLKKGVLYAVGAFVAGSAMEAGTQAAEEGVQKAAEIAAGEIAKAVHNSDEAKQIEHTTLGKAVDDVVNEMKAAFGSFLLLGSAGKLGTGAMSIRSKKDFVETSHPESMGGALAKGLLTGGEDVTAKEVLTGKTRRQADTSGVQVLPEMDAEQAAEQYSDEEIAQAMRVGAHEEQAYNLDQPDSIDRVRETRGLPQATERGPLSDGWLPAEANSDELHDPVVELMNKPRGDVDGLVDKQSESEMKPLTPRMQVASVLDEGERVLPDSVRDMIEQDVAGADSDTVHLSYGGSDIASRYARALVAERDRDQSKYQHMEAAGGGRQQGHDGKAGEYAKNNGALQEQIAEKTISDAGAAEDSGGGGTRGNAFDGRGWAASRGRTQKDGAKIEATVRGVRGYLSGVESLRDVPFGDPSRDMNPPLMQAVGEGLIDEDGLDTIMDALHDESGQSAMDDWASRPEGVTNEEIADFFGPAVAPTKDELSRQFDTEWEWMRDKRDADAEMHDLVVQDIKNRGGINLSSLIGWEHVDGRRSHGVADKETVKALLDRHGRSSGIVNSKDTGINADELAASIKSERPDAPFGHVGDVTADDLVNYLKDAPNKKEIEQDYRRGLAALSEAFDQHGFDSKRHISVRRKERKALEAEQIQAAKLAEGRALAHAASLDGEAEIGVHAEPPTENILPPADRVEYSRKGDVGSGHKEVAYGRAENVRADGSGSGSTGRILDSNGKGRAPDREQGSGRPSQGKTGDIEASRDDSGQGGFVPDRRGPAVHRGRDAFAPDSAPVRDGDAVGGDVERGGPKFSRSGGPSGGAGKVQVSNNTLVGTGGARVQRLESVINAGLKQGHKFQPGSFKEVHGYGEKGIPAPLNSVRTMAGMWGNEIIFFDISTPGPFSIDGVVLPSDPDTMFVNANAQSPHLEVLGHELMHTLAFNDKALYSEFATTVLKHSNKYTEYIKKMRRLGKGDKQAMAPDKILEDFAADAAGDCFTDPQFWSDLKNKQTGSRLKMVSSLLSRMNSILQMAKSVAVWLPFAKKHLKDYETVRDKLVEVMTKYADRYEGGLYNNKPTFTNGMPHFLRRENVPVVVFENAAVESRFGEARGITPTKWYEKEMDWVRRLTRSFTRSFKHLDSTKWGSVVNVLRLQRKTPEYSKHKAAEAILTWTGNLSENGREAFARIVILRDMMKDIDSGVLSEGNLPFGLENVAEVKSELGRLEKLAKAHPEIGEAVDSRNRYMNDIKQQLVDGGFLSKAVMQDDAYYHHQVMQHMNAKKGLGIHAAPDMRNKGKGWQKARQGVGLDYNTDYLESEFEVLSQSIAQIETKRHLDRIGQEQNIYKDLRQMAVEENQRRASKALTSKDKGAGKDPLLPYRQQIATALGQLSMFARQGLLVYDEYWEGTVQNLVNSSNAELLDVDAQDPKVFGFLSYLMEHKGLGSKQAATVFKVVKERKELVHEILGEKEKTWKDFVPEGYTIWKPELRTRFYQATTITEKVLDEILAGTKSMDDPGVLRSVYARGLQEQWVIPSEVAAQLDEFSEIRSRDPWLEKIAWMQNKFKQSVLFLPWRVLKYNINNTSGDMDIAFAYDPKIVSHYTRRALVDSVREMQGKTRPELKDEFDLMQRLDVVGSGWSLHDLEGASREMKAAMKNLKGGHTLTSDRAREFLEGWYKGKPIIKAGEAYWDGITALTAARENVLRIAAFRYFRDELSTGKAMYGASKKGKIDAITDIDEKAATLARELIGDYGNISSAGQSIRRYMIPFYSWLEINAPRYVRLLRNLPHEDASYGVANRVGGKAIKTTAKGGLLLFKTHLLMGLVMAWNRSVAPEDDEKMREMKRGQMHMLMPWTNEDGSRPSIRLQGALSDALSWFGGEDLPQDVMDVVDGKKTINEKAVEAGDAAGLKIYRGVSPFIKAPIELYQGLSTYPDPSNPRTIRDRLKYLSRVFALDVPYKYFSDEPVKGGVSEHNFLVTWNGLFFTETIWAKLLTGMHGEWFESGRRRRGCLSPQGRLLTKATLSTITCRRCVTEI